MRSKLLALCALTVSLAFAKDAPQTMPLISLPDAQGKTVNSVEWKGKMVVLDFWATWCVACREAFPVLSELKAKYGEKLMVVGIATDKMPTEKVAKFAKKQKIDYLVLHDSEDAEAPVFGFESLPSLYVYGADGKLLAMLKGLDEVNKKKLAQLTATLL